MSEKAEARLSSRQEAAQAGRETLEEHAGGRAQALDNLIRIQIAV